MDTRSIVSKKIESEKYSKEEGKLKMKKMKKAVGLLLSMALILSLAMPAFAATTPDPSKSGNSGNTKGTITITNPAEGQTYDVYQMFELESYNNTLKAYSYKPVGKWADFVTAGAGKNYFEVKNGYVIIKDSVTIGNDSAAAATLAKEALAFAKAQGIAPTRADLSKAAGSTTIAVNDLQLGYYLVESSQGSLCSLTTTKNTAEIIDKNGAPTVDKKVEENGAWGTENDAAIGGKVNFTTTITVQAGAENYVLHDKMTGLTLDDTTDIKVTYDGNTVNASADTYTISKNPGTDDCAFEISFKDAYVQGLAAGTQITVTYSATVNTDAVVRGDGNSNETWLSYGVDSNSVHKKTTTYTYDFQLVKTDSANKVLAGAEFKLYDAATGGNEIKLVKDGNAYRPAVTAGEKATDVVIEAGNVVIKGLDGGKYYLEETKQPDGYNKISERQEITIEKATTLNAAVTDGTWESGGVHVINYTGAELPSTGGMGTTIFYIAGSILLIGAGILLIVRKRMKTPEESK